MNRSVFLRKSLGLITISPFMVTPLLNACTKDPEGGTLVTEDGKTNGSLVLDLSFSLMP